MIFEQFSFNAAPKQAKLAAELVARSPELVEARPQLLDEFGDEETALAYIQSITGPRAPKRTKAGLIKLRVESKEAVGFGAVVLGVQIYHPFDRPLGPKQLLGERRIIKADQIDYLAVVEEDWEHEAVVRMLATWTKTADTLAFILPPERRLARGILALMDPLDDPGPIESPESADNYGLGAHNDIQVYVGHNLHPLNAAGALQLTS